MTARAYNIKDIPLREIDCIIAQRIFGFVELRGPLTDCDGPCSCELVLVPPDVAADSNPWESCPPRGAISRTYWVPKYSADERAALATAERIRPHAWVRILLGRKLELMDVPAVDVSIGKYGTTSPDFSARGATLAEAVARAAALWAHRPK